MSKIKDKIIKQFREEFPRQNAHTKKLEDWLWAEKKDIEQFWLSKLEAQRANLIREVEEGLPKERDGGDPYSEGDLDDAIELAEENGYNQCRQKVKEFLKGLKE